MDKVMDELLREQKKTNELLQTIASSMEQNAIKIDIDYSKVNKKVVIPTFNGTWSLSKEGFGFKKLQN
ncbi:hypothetical protein KI112_002776 [Enterococcus faecalis]|uniref:hypothetical protein n=1 Tax=Enterococcus faecalis TaxID=1351 RepID=UPI000CF70803|nr:hypothetical protein [Enterococcus faecalis]EGO8337515.1 hypothetical protein [Enterococcus faecalis]EHQ8843154.1 hypothetical protein [Enterococcus faecalis]EHV2921798.1 hypothetical protein [Enterococcus faecalis]EJC3118017.1 hypothetical protein [Enterococcus faecalis]PQC17696.1 hypothetical protein CUM91_01680 [Enterococcus faecalis]